MRRLHETPTRQEINETVETHEKDMCEKLEELDTIATDTETVRETLDSLDRAGSEEGLDAAESSIEEAEDITIEIFDDEDDKLEDIQTETNEYQDELQERSDTDESDLEKICDASAHIETQATVDELVHAKAAVLEDIDYLNEEITDEQEALDESERQQQDHVNRVHLGRG